LRAKRRGRARQATDRFTNSDGALRFPRVNPGPHASRGRRKATNIDNLTWLMSRFWLCRRRGLPAASSGGCKGDAGLARDRRARFFKSMTGRPRRARHDACAQSGPLAAARADLVLDSTAERVIEAALARLEASPATRARSGFWYASGFGQAIGRFARALEARVRSSAKRDHAKPAVWRGDWIVDREVRRKWTR
jgi:hypothetical protein